MYYTGKSSQQEYQQKAQVQDEGEWWYAPRAAARYVAQARTKKGIATAFAMLRRWRKRCPLLGRGILTRPMPDALGRTTDFYAKKDLDALLSARSQRQQQPEVPGYTPMHDACVVLGCSEETLRQRLIAAKVHPKKVPGKMADGRPCMRAYVPQSFIDQAVADAQRSLPADKVTVLQAAEILGCSELVVRAMLHRGELARFNYQIPTLRGTSKKPGVLLYRCQVEELADKRQHKATTSRNQSQARAKARIEFLRAMLANGPIQASAGMKVATQSGLGSNRPVSEALVKQVMRAAGIKTCKLGGCGGPWAWYTTRKPTSVGELREPVTARANGKTDGRRGRRPNSAVAEMMAFCYDKHQNTSMKLANIRREAEKRFGNGAPKDDAHVTENAKRYAKKEGKPFVPRSTTKP